jgi:uncharacterized membrane protein YphA (DoxX/SURF4 family)
MSSYQIVGICFAIIGIIGLASVALERFRHQTFELRFMPLSRMMTWVLRFTIGGLFFYSGFVKANDFIGFAYKLEEYFQVFGERWPALEGFFTFFIPLAEPLAWFISVFEVALAVALIIGWFMPLTTWLSLLMMIFFTILTAYSHITNSVTDCGCFGDALKLTPFESFMKDVILTGMLIPLFLFRKQIKSIGGAKIAGGITAFSFVATGIFSWLCYQHLPLIDYRPYKVGTDLAICTTAPGPEGFPKCKDWSPVFLMGGEVDLFKGKVLLVIMQDMNKAPKDRLKASGELARGLVAKGVTTIGATATSPKKVETYAGELGLDYTFTFIDQTVLKTIVRSNPGYMLLKDGVVIKKWHHNDTPSAEEVSALVP